MSNHRSNTKQSESSYAMNYAIFEAIGRSPEQALQGRAT